MNEKNLNFITKNYVSRFDEILSGENQSQMWKTASIFKSLMNDALNAPEEEFTAKLSMLCDCSKGTIDGKFIQPMNSICDFAAKEPETIQNLLKSLFAADWGNLNMRQSRITAFVSGCNELHDRYYPCNIRYYMTPGKALAFLAMYDPDGNYMYQESAARLFAECTGFDEDWGSGTSFNCAIYYRMCDELAEYIQKNQQLIFTSCKRYALENGLHADMNYHLLACDIILCNAKYKLFEGMSFSSKALEENRVLRRRQQEALICFQRYRDAREKSLEVSKGRMNFSAMVKPGTRISHIKMGEGVIESLDGENAIISFGDENRKKFNMLQSVLSGFISIDEPVYEEWKNEFGAALERRDEIQNLYETSARLLEDCISLLC